MADAIGLVISICELSAQLYKFYKDAKGRDDDISALRLQLLGLQEKSMLVRLALRRDGLQSEDQSQAERAVERCESEVKRMKERVDKLPDKSPVEGKPMTKAKLFFKGVFQNAKWPFQKSTIMAFSDDIRMCHSNLDDAIKLLQLNVSIRTIEELRALDDNVTRHMITSEAALADLKSGIEAGLQQVLQQLAKQRQELSRQAEIISNTITDEEVKKLLLDPDFQRRQGEIPVTNDKTYDLFRDDVQDYPQAAGLSKFLQTGTGIFWISGQAATGKSTLMKHLSNPKRRNSEDLWVWDGYKDCTIACHFCWIAGSDNQKSQPEIATWTVTVAVVQHT